MAFTGNEDHTIPIGDAAEMTKRFRQADAGQPIAAYYSKDAIMELLNQTNAVGIRCYFARDENNQMSLVICGVDTNENDIVEPGKIMEFGLTCPPRCPTNNPLNS